MKIANPNSRFEPCLEFTGRAVIVDVTPLRKEQSQFGEQEVFRVVFEVDMDKPDGSRFCVWSRRMTPTLGEKSNLRKFIRGLYGRDLTKPELANYDTEVLVGMGAQLVAVTEHEETRAKTELGAAQKDTARELSAKLASLKGIVWVGVALFLFGLASLFYPPLKLIIGSVTTSVAITAGGLALMILPTLVIGHEMLILFGVAVGVGGWFLAHRYGTLRGMVNAAKAAVDEPSTKA